MGNLEHRGDVGRRLLAESIELQRHVAETPLEVEPPAKHTARTVALVAAGVLVTLAFAAVVFLVVSS